MEADHVAGHNVMFDIQALVNTMSSQSGYSNHKEAREAVTQFTERMTKGRICYRYFRTI